MRVQKLFRSVLHFICFCSAAVMLAGCIVSTGPLFNKSSAAKLIRPGVWQQDEWNSATKVWEKAEGDFRVVLRGNSYSITKQNEPGVMVFHFYQLSGPWHIASGHSEAKSEERLYGLVRLEKGNLLSFATTCDSTPEPGIAKFGIRPKPFACQASNQQGLRRYFTHLVKSDPVPFARFRPAGTN